MSIASEKGSTTALPEHENGTLVVNMTKYERSITAVEIFEIRLHAGLVIRILRFDFPCMSPRMVRHIQRKRPSKKGQYES